MDNLLIKVTEQGMHSMVRRFVTPFVVQGKADRTGRDMYIIAGLGNPERKYDGTRHNVGFAVVDILAKEYGIDLTEKKFKAIYGKGRIGEEKVILAKPLTYMNLSGKALQYWMRKLSIPQDRVIVILDDLNIPFKSIRIRPNGADGGHNGLKNINEVLGNQNYARIRIGIGGDFKRGRQVNFVLGKWNKEEEQDLPEIIAHAAKAVLAFGTLGITETMNQYTRK